MRPRRHPSPAGDQEARGRDDLRDDSAPGGAGDSGVGAVDECDLEDDVDDVGDEHDAQGSPGVLVALQVSGAGEGQEQERHAE